MSANNFPIKKCFYYGKPGHQIKDCYKRQADEGRNKQIKHKSYFGEEEEDHSHEL